MNLLGQEDISWDTKISPEKLKYDLSVLKSSLIDLHGDLYYYNSAETIKNKFDEIERELDGPMSSIEYFRLLTPLLELIGNGHTHIVPSKLFYKQMRSKMGYFPLDLYVHQDIVYVLRNNSNDGSIVEGSIVEKINGQNAFNVIKEIASNLTRDGFNMSWPITRATNRFSEFYLFYFEATSVYDVVIANDKGIQRNIQLNGLIKKEIETNKTARYGEMKNWHELEQAPYTMEYEGTTAIMSLRTFSNKEIKKGNKMKSKKWFQQSFENINEKGIDKLIIDLRGNGGGDEEPTIELFSHLYEKEFVFYKDVYLQERKIPNGEWYEDNIFFLNLYAKIVTKRKNGKYVLKAKGLKPYKPAKEQFKGEVVVLTDPYSFSATGEMSAILKEHNRVTFVGEEPGGNPNQNTSGAMLVLNLPNSGVRAVVPVVVFKMNVTFENTGRGVLPDYPIKNTIHDELNGVDSVMEFAKKL